MDFGTALQLTEHLLKLVEINDLEYRLDQLQLADVPLIKSLEAVRHIKQYHIAYINTLAVHA